MRASGLLHLWEFLLDMQSVGFNYLFIFPPIYFALWDSKAHHRPAEKSISCCLETFLCFKTPFPGWISIPTSFVSLYIYYLLSYLFLNTMGCLSGCLMSSASIQKLFCGICSAFKCSFDEFVGEKVVSPSYSSTILGPPPPICLFLFLFCVLLVSCARTHCQKHCEGFPLRFF